MYIPTAAQQLNVKEDDIQEASKFFSPFLPFSGRYSTKTQYWPMLCFSLSNTSPKMAEKAEINRRLAVLVYTFVCKFCAVVAINFVKIVQTVLKIKF